MTLDLLEERTGKKQENITILMFLDMVAIFLFMWTEFGQFEISVPLFIHHAYKQPTGN